MCVCVCVVCECVCVYPSVSVVTMFDSGRFLVLLSLVMFGLYIFGLSSNKINMSGSGTSFVSYNVAGHHPHLSPCPPRLPLCSQSSLLSLLCVYG